MHIQAADAKRSESEVQHRWSHHGWFGVIAGGSGWMLFTGVFLIANGEIFTGMLPLASGLMTLSTGAALWKLRNRLSFNSAMTVLLVVTLLAASTAIACTSWFAPPELLARMRWPSDPIPLIGLLAIVLGTGIWINYSRANRRRKNG